ncbi:MAG: nucleotidyltransferase domain-containing protein [Candidatus Bathyarchaeota archaeon]|nr:nucleotidyltransferase domain-containing protein [Candidatus Bathyarchaeota archaeon]MDH5788168.1 nucleotidyltransferase domain-containing protein [Candidatus Bathyarchaeota archaeon]
MAARLKGKNRIKKFEQVADEFAANIASLKGVSGIVFIGGLVRGFADRFSDLDIIVFLKRRDEALTRRIRKMGSDREKRFGIDIDLEAHFLQDFSRWKWDETDKWDFSKAKIVFDPEGKIKRVFKEKLKVPKDFWVRRLVICAEYLKWYCCSPRADVGTIAESWIERGDPVSAHYCVTYSTDLLLKIIFALNKEFLPVQKWRMLYSYRLKWLPENYETLIKEAMTVRNFSVKDLSRRMKAIQKMWHETMTKIEEETGLTTNLISKYYVEKALHQTWMPTNR